MRCPKCGFERQAIHDEFIPVTECPKCRVIYERYREILDRSKTPHKEIDRTEAQGQPGSWEEKQPGRWHYTKQATLTIEPQNIAKVVWLAVDRGLMNESFHLDTWLLRKGWSYYNGKVVKALGNDDSTISRDDFQSEFTRDLREKDASAIEVMSEVFCQISEPLDTYKEGKPSPLDTSAAEEILQIYWESMPEEVLQQIEAESTNRNFILFMLRKTLAEIFDKEFFFVYVPIALLVGILIAIW